MLEINGYTLKEKLNENKNNVLFKAVRNSDSRKVILKFINKNVYNIYDLARLKHEYEMTRLINIDGINKILSIEKNDNSFALVIEDNGYIALSDLIKHVHLDLKSFLKIGINISKILFEIHNKNIIHKDISTSNILIEPDTFNVKLTDFEFACNIDDESSDSDFTEGTLYYISPEQTGRLNVKPDNRSDLYSLGAVFYEILSGEPPFVADDEMDLIYFHIARKAEPLTIKNPMIPQVISDIVSKLLEKDPNNRYQSILGLKADLIQCLENYEKTNSFEYFVPGLNDHWYKLRQTNKVYGRDYEIKEITDTFNRISKTGYPEVFFISGNPGIGKSSIILEFKKNLFGKKYNIIEGKFEQLKQNIPYSAFIDGLKQFLRNLLNDNPDKINILKENIISRIGKNLYFLTKFIPEIENIVDIPFNEEEINFAESEKFFKIAFQELIKILATEETPLILIFEDIQWIDLSTLRLFDYIFEDVSNKYLLLISTFRDNEEDKIKFIENSFSYLKDRNIIFNRINLSFLEKKVIKEIISDMFTSISQEDINKISDELFTRTKGNPFFIKQLIKIFYDEEVIFFDKAGERWRFVTDKINHLVLPSDILELITNKVKQLSEELIYILKIASCFGNTFELGLISKITEMPVKKVYSILKQAVKEGLIYPLNTSYKLVENIEHEEINTLVVNYKFIHDRVLQTVYSLIKDDEKRSFHFLVGKTILYSLKTDNELDDMIFIIVNNLNIGYELVSEPEKRKKLSQLNYRAAKKAQNSGSYKHALECYENSIKFLPEDDIWENEYEYTYGIFKDYIRCLYFTENTDKAETAVSEALFNIKNKAHQYEIMIIKIECLTNLGMYLKAFKIGQEILRDFNIILGNSEEEWQKIFNSEFEISVSKVKNYFDSHVSSQETSSDNSLIMKVLSDLVSPSFNISQTLFNLVIVKITLFSIENGFFAESSFAFSTYAILLINLKKDYFFAEKMAIEAINYVEKNKIDNLKTKVYHAVGGWVTPWCRPITESLLYLNKSFSGWRESGDIAFAGFSGMQIAIQLFMKGEKLDILAEKLSKISDFFFSTKNSKMNDILIPIQKFIEIMKSSGTYNPDKENLFLKRLIDEKYIMGVSTYYIIKISYLYLIGEYKTALNTIKENQKYLNFTYNWILETEFVFYYLLTIFASYNEMDDVDKAFYDNEIEDYMKLYSEWNSACPDNFSHKYYLILAEYESIKGEFEKALEYYDLSNEEAKKFNFINVESIACERAARFLNQRKKHKICRIYLFEAVSKYNAINMNYKVKCLKEEFAELFTHSDNAFISSEFLTSDSMHSVRNAEKLDIRTIFQASQVISGEMKLEDLIEKIMLLVIKNTGAERGLMFLYEQNQLFLKADGTIETINIYKDPVTIESLDNIPGNIINNTMRTKDIILNSSIDYINISNDEYILNNKIRSFLSVPFFYKGELSGILYFETSLIEGAFNKTKIEIVKILATQASISIENAKLYSNLENLVQIRTSQLKDALEELEKLAVTDKLTGMFNRRKFDEMLDIEMQRARRFNRDLSMMMLDIDLFKNVNDTFGHLTGDEVLKELAVIILHNKRNIDFAARWGGEEFVILIPETESSHVFNFSERLRKIVEEYIFPKIEKLTISIGVTQLKPEDTAEDFCLRTDIALYKAKNSGRNRTIIE